MLIKYLMNLLPKIFQYFFTNVKNLAKKLHYHNKLNKFNNIPKKTWQLLRTLLLANSSSGIPNLTTAIIFLLPTLLQLLKNLVNTLST